MTLMESPFESERQMVNKIKVLSDGLTGPLTAQFSCLDFEINGAQFRAGLEEEFYKLLPANNRACCSLVR